MDDGDIYTALKFYEYIKYLWICVVRAAPLAPEIIPPVTRMVTYSKTSKPLRSKSGPQQTPPSETGSRSVGGADANHGWTGGEFTPANRLPASSDQSSARTKRYSSQRLRNVTADTGPIDTHATADSVSPTSLGTATQLVNATTMMHMPARPVPSSAFYGKDYFSLH